MKHDVTNESGKAVPAIFGLILSYITLEELVMVMTLIYIVIQIGYLIWKWRKEAKGYSKKDEEST